GHVDAVARAVVRGIDHVQPQVGRYVHPRACGQLQLTGAVLDVRQAVDVELEDLGRVLHTESVTRTQILVDPDVKRLSLGLGLRRHAHPPWVLAASYSKSTVPDHVTNTRPRGNERGVGTGTLVLRAASLITQRSSPRGGGTWHAATTRRRAP